MCSQLKEKQLTFYHHVIEPLRKNRKVQHAYLIETNDVDQKEDYVLEFVEQLFLLRQNKEIITPNLLHQYIVKNHFPDLKILKPSSNVIKKEELLEIKNSFRDKSIYGGYQIYIIYDAEKLNSSSANTILKFLEEPEDDIIAVLVTDNRYKVLDTILSRCQILSFCQDEKVLEKKISPPFITFIDLLINRKKKDLMLSYQFILDEIFPDKDSILSTLQTLEIFFAQILQKYYNINQSNCSEMVIKYENHFSLNEIIKFLSIFDEKQKELEYNLNLKAWIDSFLLRLMEV